MIVAHVTGGHMLYLQEGVVPDTVKKLCVQARYPITCRRFSYSPFTLLALIYLNNLPFKPDFIKKIIIFLFLFIALFFFHEKWFMIERTVKSVNPCLFLFTGSDY